MAARSRVLQDDGRTYCYWLLLCMILSSVRIILCLCKPLHHLGKSKFEIKTLQLLRAVDTKMEQPDTVSMA